MARPKGQFEHGTVQRYRQGNCDGFGNRCSPCKLAMSEYNSQRGAGIPPAQRRDAFAKVTPISGRTRTNPSPAQSNSQPITMSSAPRNGETERWVREQFEPYRAEHGVRVELLLSGARIMDDPTKAGLHPQTMRQMDAIIEKITAKKKTKSGGRLAVVSAMAGRRMSS